MREFSTPGDIYNALPPRVVFGVGASDRVGEEVDRLGAKRALVLSTPGRSGMAERVVERLGGRCVGLMPEAISQVPIELLHRTRAKARGMDVDCLVSVGGGASIGLGKGIALDLDVPVITVPTTYSGSEMTGFCGITIEGVKRMHQSLRMLASTVIYDPALSVSLPVAVSAASALNALAHCVDVIYVPTASPVIIQAAGEGARAILDALPRVARQPDDLEARADLLYGAYLAGAALTGGFALQHGLAHVLGGTYGVPHGLSHSLVLPHVTAYNARFAPAGMAKLAASMGVTDVAGAIFDMTKAVGLPIRLTEVGFDGGAIDEAARITVETDNGLNPGPVTVEAVRGILEAALAGRRPEPVA
ncbi:maleylacetate reductase [Skermanella stibiiresistens]|nr:maleylacetate reductase [Skermanella stibiiresistens]